jgi:hypothetical protein
MSALPLAGFLQAPICEAAVPHPVDGEKPRLAIPGEEDEDGVAC